MASGKKDMICAEHGEALNMFCSQDKEVICHTCWEDNHPNHPITPLSKAHADLRAEVTSALGHLKNDLSEVENLRSRQNDMTTSNRARNLELRAEIRAQFEELREKLNLKEEQAMKEIDQLNMEAESKLTTLDNLLAGGRERVSVLQAAFDVAGFGAFLQWWKESKTKRSLIGQCPELSSRLSFCRGAAETQSESLLGFVMFEEMETSILMRIKPHAPMLNKPDSFQTGFSFESSRGGFSFDQFTRSQGLSFGWPKQPPPPKGGFGFGT